MEFLLKIVLIDVILCKRYTRAMHDLAKSSVFSFIYKLNFVMQWNLTNVTLDDAMNIYHNIPVNLDRWIAQ